MKTGRATRPSELGQAKTCERTYGAASKNSKETGGERSRWGVIRTGPESNKRRGRKKKKRYPGRVAEKTQDDDVNSINGGEKNLLCKEKKYGGGKSKSSILSSTKGTGTGRRDRNNIGRWICNASNRHFTQSGQRKKRALKRSSIPLLRREGRHRGGWRKKETTTNGTQDVGTRKPNTK